MPERRTIEKARKDKRAGKASTTQAGEFVHEEIRRIRRGKHGAKSPQQAIAIGLSKARRAGVALRPPGKGKAKAKTRKSAEYAYEAGQGKRRPRRRPRVSRAVSRVLKRESRTTASPSALSRQTRRAASHRSASARSAAAKKAARTKGSIGRSAAAKKAAEHVMGDRKTPSNAQLAARRARASTRPDDVTLPDARLGLILASGMVMMRDASDEHRSDRIRGFQPSKSSVGTCCWNLRERRHAGSALKHLNR
jgi:hypothetical protein